MTYLMIEFTNKALSFYTAKKESNYYAITQHATIALSNSSTEIADGTIYNPTRIKEYLASTIKTLPLSKLKPKTIFFAPAIQNLSEDVKSLKTLQIALCSINLPLKLNYILPIPIESLITKIDNKTHIPFSTLQESLKSDTLVSFKSNNHQAPIFFIVLTILSISILGLILYIASIKTKNNVFTHASTVNTLETTKRKLQEKIIPLKTQAKKTKYLTLNNIDPAILQKNNKTLQLLLHDIEKSISDDTYITSITIAMTQTPESMNKTSNHPSKEKSLILNTKVLSIKGCSAIPPSAMKLFINLERNPLLENVSINHLEQNPVNSAYQFTIQAIIKNLTN